MHDGNRVKIMVRVQTTIQQHQDTNLALEIVDYLQVFSVLIMLKVLVRQTEDIRKALKHLVQHD